uniref:Uncharacterized protein n=1 Tax=uncultured prokaryote TaxID=198431 RepID=A0A0H5Q5V7_9ZZZZ|nr:hypothetical protein [uncultured prokaryote]
MNTYEGAYYSKGSLVLCFRRETGGVARFENLRVSWKDISSDDCEVWTIFLNKSRVFNESPAWHEDEPLDFD